MLPFVSFTTIKGKEKKTGVGGRGGGRSLGK